MTVVENPYQSPRTSQEIAAVARQRKLRDNRMAILGFSLALIFPIFVLLCTAALFREDSFQQPRWRVHRTLRRSLFYASFIPPAAATVSLLALRWKPRRLAVYGLLLGSLGSTYLLLVVIGVLRS